MHVPPTSPALRALKIGPSFSETCRRNACAKRTLLQLNEQVL